MYKRNLRTNMNIYITKYSILIGPYTFILVEFREKM